MISSAGNQQVKNVIALEKKPKARKDQKLFVAEGTKMFLELPRDRIEKVYISESYLRQKGAGALIEKCEGRYETVIDEVFKTMSDTQTPQGILALVRQYEYTLDDILQQKEHAHIIILETLQDPGNLGTILRAGEGAGITGVIMNKQTADIYNPKVIRSTMGSIYRVPFVYVENLKSALDEVKRNKIRLFAAHLKGTYNYEEEDFRGSVGFLIGNEAAGLSGEIAGMADAFVKIPMAGQVESLNAAMAASVLMFETARQRRAKSL